MVPNMHHKRTGSDLAMVHPSVSMAVGVDPIGVRSPTSAPNPPDPTTKTNTNRSTNGGGGYSHSHSHSHSHGTPKHGRDDDYYVLEVASLVKSCRRRISCILGRGGANTYYLGGLPHRQNLLELDEVLRGCEALIREYLSSSSSSSSSASSSSCPLNHCNGDTTTNGNKTSFVSYYQDGEQKQSTPLSSFATTSPLPLPLPPPQSQSHAQTQTQSQTQRQTQLHENSVEKAPYENSVHHLSMPPPSSSSDATNLPTVAVAVAVGVGVGVAQQHDSMRTFLASNKDGTQHHHHHHTTHSFPASISTSINSTSSTSSSTEAGSGSVDAVLFHLLVTLELCHLRLKDADALLGCGQWDCRSPRRRRRRCHDHNTTPNAPAATTATSTNEAGGERSSSGRGSGRWSWSWSFRGWKRTLGESPLLGGLFGLGSQTPEDDEGYDNNDEDDEECSIKEYEVYNDVNLETNEENKEMDHESKMLERRKIVNKRDDGRMITSVVISGVSLLSLVTMPLWCPLVSSLSSSLSSLLGGGGPRDGGRTTSTRQKLSSWRTAVCAVVGASVLRRKWMHLAVNARLINSRDAIEFWKRQWAVAMTCSSPRTNRDKHSDYDDHDHDHDHPLRNLESSFWQSQGALRFLLLKRVMELVYASIGTAIRVTGPPSESNNSGDVLWMPVAAAAASYHVVTGPDATASRAAEAVSSSSSARDLLVRAWGILSHPSVKRMSLEVSRRIKGAAVATRISIAGVPCFVLSRDPYPTLSTAIQRYHRQQQRRDKGRQHLDTIVEEETSPHDDVDDHVDIDDSYHSTSSTSTSTTSSTRFPQVDVILHLTGGGFFAHTVATDLPFLIDWSGAAGGAVVICPEYALLPEHTFPVALHQITDVYLLLKNAVKAQTVLGIRPRKIVLTGESAGGNLAAALCVHLSMMSMSSSSPSSSSASLSASSSLPTTTIVNKNNSDNLRLLPDALLLGCPALHRRPKDPNTLSPSFLQGTHSHHQPNHQHSSGGGANAKSKEPTTTTTTTTKTQPSPSSPLQRCVEHDPVLPAGLLSAISEAYAPSVQDESSPLAWPGEASDDILRRFPPTLLCTADADPLLEDSVRFHGRLRRLSVTTQTHSHSHAPCLVAAHHMPHAYWGLTTAGFPEARRVHHQCTEWLSSVFATEEKGTVHTPPPQTPTPPSSCRRFRKERTPQITCHDRS